MTLGFARYVPLDAFHEALAAGWCPARRWASHHAHHAIPMWWRCVDRPNAEPMWGRG